MNETTAIFGIQNVMNTKDPEDLKLSVKLFADAINDKTIFDKIDITGKRVCWFFSQHYIPATFPVLYSPKTANEWFLRGLVDIVSSHLFQGLKYRNELDMLVKDFPAKFSKELHDVMVAVTGVNATPVNGLIELLNGEERLQLSYLMGSLAMTGVEADDYMRFCANSEYRLYSGKSYVAFLRHHYEI